MGFIDLSTNKSTYGLPNEILLVQEAIKAFTDYIESKLSECLQVEDNPDRICDLTWKHDDCKVLMDILFDLTLEEKYRSKW